MRTCVVLACLIWSACAPDKGSAPEVDRPAQSDASGFEASEAGTAMHDGGTRAEGAAADAQAPWEHDAGNAAEGDARVAPGMPDTETKRGLYPAPPALAKQRIDPAQAFWVIKHGIKASGMPAWGRSMDDEYIWNLAAFVQALPTLDAAHYQALVESSEGHSHGGGEAHAHGDADEHDMVAPMPPADAPAPSTDEHDAHPHAH